MKQVAFALSVPQRSIALATLIALLAWTMGLPAWIHNAEASDASNFSDLLSDSDLGVSANHTITFTLSNAVDPLESLTVTFDPDAQSFDLSSIATSSSDITISGGTISQVATEAGCTGAVSEVYVNIIDTTNDYIEFETCASDTIATTTVVTIDVGNTNFIANPATANSYKIQLGGTSGTTGITRVAIIDDVLVTASVDTIFIFTINGVTSGVSVNDDVVTTSGNTTATTVPFGTLSPGTPKLLAQRLTVDTNADNGFSVTVSADQTLTAGNSATIDTFIDGGATASSTLWQGPAGTLGVDTTYGHWGITSDDDAVSVTPTRWGIGEAAYQGNFVGNPVEVFYYNGPTASTSGVGVGSTTVAYKVQITGLQEAATDYQANLTYVATPVF